MATYIFALYVAIVMYMYNDGPRGAERCADARSSHTSLIMSEPLLKLVRGNVLLTKETKSHHWLKLWQCHYQLVWLNLASAHRSAPLCRRAPMDVR